MVSEKKIFKDFPMKNLYAPGCGHFWPGGHNLNKLSRGPYVILHTKYQSSWLCGFRDEDFLRFSDITLCKTYKPRGGAIFGPRVII